jgi:hypothetical protein
LAYLAAVYDNGGGGVDIPLLGTVKDVVLAILGLLGGSLDVCDIGTCSWLSDGDTDADLALDERCDKAVAQLLVAELDDGGNTEGKANSDGSSGTASSTTSELRTLDMAWIGGVGGAYLVDEDGGVQVVVVLDLESTRELVDANALEGFNW